MFRQSPVLDCHISHLAVKCGEVFTKVIDRLSLSGRYFCLLSEPATSLCLKDSGGAVEQTKKLCFVVYSFTIRSLKSKET